MSQDLTKHTRPPPAVAPGHHWVYDGGKWTDFDDSYIISGRDHYDPNNDHYDPSGRLRSSVVYDEYMSDPYSGVPFWGAAKDWSFNKGRWSNSTWSAAPSPGIPVPGTPGYDLVPYNSNRFVPFIRRRRFYRRRRQSRKFY